VLLTQAGERRLPLSKVQTTIWDPIIFLQECTKVALIQEKWNLKKA
jgi:hypothetical protein